MSELLNAGDLLGKTLFARVRVAMYAEPLNGAKVTGYIEPGGNIGTIYSYLDVLPGKRNVLYWMFRTTNTNTYFYVPHAPGSFDFAAMQNQGVYTEKQKVAIEKEKNATLVERVETNVKNAAPWILAAIVAIPLLKEVIRKKL